MAFLSVRGLIIRSVLYKESDRIINILTSDRGIVSVRASGAAKASSRFSYSTQPMMLCDFVLSKSHDFFYLREAEIIEAFQTVQEDIERLTASAHLLEITSDVCVDSESCHEMYPLLLHALYELTKRDRDFRLTVSVFEWKVPDLLGFSADLGICSCGEQDARQYGAFSFTHCRIYCRKAACLTKAGSYQLISPGCMDALVFIYASPVNKIFSFSVSPKIQDEMTRITRRYLCERLEKRYERMDLLIDMPAWDEKAANIPVKGNHPDCPA